MCVWCEQSEKEEVTIKRMIGLKKDEYFVDGKHATRQEVANMLETAGFSKSNPYYIVEQGKVTTITEMKDNQRLALIKDVAGTNVYEEKKGESEKILNDSLRKMDEIKNNLGMIEARLEKLDKEKKELAEYYALDKERRSLHHALLSRRIKILREKLTELDRKKQELRIDSGQGTQDQQKFEAKLEVLQRSVDEMRDALKSITEEKQALDKDETQHIQKESEQKAEVDRMRKAIQGNKDEIKATEKTLAENEKAVKQLEKSLEQIEPKIKQKKESQDKTTEEFHAVNRELETLQALSRKSDYANQAERDKALNADIAELTKAKTEYEIGIEKFRKDITAANKKKAESQKKEVDLQNKLASLDKNMGHYDAKKKELHNKKVEFERGMREAQKSKADCKKQKDKLTKDLEKVDKSLEYGMPNGCDRALRFLNDYCKREKIKGYHGPLIDLIQCNEKYYSAVEQAGGKKMFNVVVDDDGVATRLIEAMKENRAGRISIMPLSKLRPHSTKFPKDLQDAEPLAKCIRCEDKFRVAVEDALGHVLLCSTLEVAMNYRQEHDLECVTIDGDKVARKGAIKGGWHNTKSSKLKLNQQKQDARKNADDLDAKEAAATKEFDDLVQRQAKNETEERDLTHNHKKDQLEREAIVKELTYLQTDIRECDDDIAANEKLIEDNISEGKETQHKIDTLRDQLAQAFSTTITDAQKSRLLELTGQQTQLKSRQKKEEVDKSKLEKEKATNNCELQRLRAEVQDIKFKLQSMLDTSKEAALELEEQKLKELGALQKACFEDSKAKDQELSDTKKRLRQGEDELKTVKAKLKELSNEASKSKNLLSSVAADREKCQRDIEVANRQLMELGSLPEAFEKYKDKSEKNLKDLLDKAAEKLGKFQNVNKKAMDQFNQFTDQKEKFQDRMKELREGEDSIRKLIQNLDNKKDNALQTTFKMVARHFSDVFKTIVPGGEGKLIMRTKDVEGDDDAGGSSRRAATREYTGIGVEVRFAAGTNVQKMRELSGGQKCVVALTIIFAIQRCDPAPFYLFDEVDANLDPMYRGAVADMISKQKQDKSASGDGCQFLTSSFHEELVKAADVHWLVSHSGMSRITKGTVDDQLKIVRKNQQQPQGMGAASRR